MWTLIQGASRGLGRELVHQLHARGDQVIATCRDPAGADLGVPTIPLDVTDEASIEAAAAAVAEHTERLHLLMNVAGVLHGDGFGPERRLAEVAPDNLARAFAVNASGPLLVAKHFARFLQHDERAVLANVSARVGSISDDRLGGWYAYRASKAAQNLFTKNLSIELTRRFETLVVIALHPGTVDTDLSAPFQRSVKPEKLFSVERAARQFLNIVDRVGPKDNGRFIAWDGATIPW
ncbi:MAG: SDR family oxidoreductase [Deltaproteobacteria bacterium]